MARKKKAEVVEDGADGAEATPKKKKKKLKILLPAFLVLGAISYQFGIFPPAAADETAAEGPEVIEDGEVVPIPELVLNLADAELHYLRVGVALILEKGTSKESIEKELPIASDVAVEVLSAMTFSELKAPGAKETVKEALTKRVREAYEEAYGDPKVARVIFTSFVMQ